MQLRHGFSKILVFSQPNDDVLLLLVHKTEGNTTTRYYDFRQFTIVFWYSELSESFHSSSYYERSNHRSHGVYIVLSESPSIPRHYLFNHTIILLKTSFSNSILR